MTTEVAIREAIRAEIERAKAAWTAYPLLVDHENKGDIDLALQVVPYVAVDILFLDADQMDLGRRPLTCDYGQITVAVGVKDGSGTAGLAAVRDHFIPYLQLRDDLGPVRTEVARRHPPRKANGFYYLPFLVNFWAQSTAPVVP